MPGSDSDSSPPQLVPDAATQRASSSINSSPSLGADAEMDSSAVPRGRTRGHTPVPSSPPPPPCTGTPEFWLPSHQQFVFPAASRVFSLELGEGQKPRCLALDSVPGSTADPTKTSCWRIIPQRKKQGQLVSPTPPLSLEVTRGGGQPSGTFSDCLCAEWEEGRWKQQQGGLSQVWLSRCGDEAALPPASPALFSGHVLKTARAWVVHVADINSGACFCRNRLEWVVSLIFLQWFAQSGGVGSPECYELPLPSPPPPPIGYVDP